MGMCGPEDPFHASPVVRKGPISSKRVSSQGPLLRKFGNFSLYILNFFPNFSSQAPKFGNFQLTSLLFQRQVSVRKSHTSEIRAAHPYLKKSWVHPPGLGTVYKHLYDSPLSLPWKVRPTPEEKHVRGLSFSSEGGPKFSKSRRR